MNKKDGIVFWIEGFSGSGKTSISKNIQNDISKLFGTTIILSGDVLRKFFDKNGYSKKERIQNSHKFSQILKYFTEQKINIIYSAVCLNNSARNIYKKNIKNLFQIYIKSDVKKIIKLKKKATYRNKKNILGIHIKPEYPLKPDVIIENNFDKSVKNLSRELILKIKKKLI
tara:strand:+ start:13163 stop:13675 length:513 start_codon:yes stop_codon:yes gene_type:complete